MEYPYASSKPWLRFPYLKMMGTVLRGYKRRPSPLIQHTPLGEEKK
jgi:hypothetical protein